MALLKRAWLPLTLALIAAIPLWRCLFLGETLGAFDQIRQMAPWNGPKPSQPWDVLQADGVLQFYVWRDLVLDSWRHFQAPLWNPYVFGGAPLLANSQSGGFYPPHILLGVLGVPTAIAVGLLAWFHLFVASLGVANLVMRLSPEGKNREVGAIVAGASFALSPFLLGWLTLASVPSTVAWIPWLLLAILRAFNSADRSLWACALTTTMIVLAGHLQFVAYGLLAALIVVLWRLGETRRPKVALGVGLAIALGIGAAMPQLAPVLSFSKYSHRRNVPTEEGFAAYNAGAIQPYELVGLVFPTLTGLPTDGIVAGDQTLPAYWPAFVKRGGNFAEGALGIGALIFGALFLLRRRSLPAVGPMAGVGILGLLLCLGGPVARLFYFGFPGWSSTGSPGRACILLVLAATVVAGVAIADRSEKDEGVGKWFPVAGIGIVALLSVYFVRFGASGLAPWIPGASPELVPTIVGNVNLGFALIAALLAGIALWRVPKAGPWLPALGLVGSLLMLPLVRTTPRENTDLTIPAKPGTLIAFVNDPWDLLTAAPALVPPNIAALTRVKDFGGYDSLIHRDVVERLREVDGQDPATPANGNMLFVKPTANPALLADKGVSEVWSRKELSGFGDPEPREGYFVYRLEAKTPSLEDSPSPGTIEGYRAHDLNLDLATGLYIGIPSWLAILALGVLARNSKGRTTQSPEAGHA